MEGRALAASAMEDITAVIRMLNEMERDGAVERYAIGGAVAATFYLEPAETMDVDVFVPVSAPAGGLIITLDPILDYLRSRGCELKNEYVMVGGWPVQFLPSSPGLIDEALREANEFDVEGSKARVFSPLHLAAIALQTGRTKDKLRLIQFREAGLIQNKEFENVLARHGLLDRWRTFEQQFPADQL